jgi:hypothetical protein
MQLRLVSWPLLACALVACGGRPPADGAASTASAPAPAPDPAPGLDCVNAPDLSVAAPTLEDWVAANDAGGVPRLLDLGGISGGFQAMLGMHRLSLRPAGGGVAAPRVELERDLGAVVGVDLGGEAWPVALETLDGERARLGSPLDAPIVRGAFASDVTGDGVPDAVLALTARGLREGPADEDAFLSTRDHQRANAYAVLLVVDAARSAAYTWPVFVSHQDRVSGEDGTERVRQVGLRVEGTPPLPWTAGFQRPFHAASRFSDRLAGQRRTRVTAGFYVFAGSPYGAPFTRREVCRAER